MNVMAENNLALSLVARFDDLERRLSPCNTDLYDLSIESVKVIKQLAEQLDYAQDEVKTYKEKCSFLEMENRQLDANLKNTREAYKKELNKRHNSKATNDELTFSSDLLSDGDFDKSEDDLDEPSKKQRVEIKFTSNVTLTPISESISRPALLVNRQISKINTRSHTFVQKRLIRTNENCTVCNSKINFYAQYCRCEDCHGVTHLHCKNRLPLPCVPHATSNQIGKKGRLITVADYCNPIHRPCIPSIIIHCCREIEKRGLNESGLYRVPGSDTEVKALVDKFIKAKTGIPKLSNVSVHVLCGVIKQFLNRLDESLITHVLWGDFVEAAKKKSAEDRIPFIITALNELPMANRNTLSYLMLHWQRIIASPVCQMPAHNLARVLGPTVVGHSTREAAASEKAFQETETMIKTMEVLLNLSSEIWTEMLNDSTPEQTVPHPTAETVNKRQSVGSRVIGGSLQSQVLNPWTAGRRQKKRTLF